MRQLRNVVLILDSRDNSLKRDRNGSFNYFVKHFYKRIYSIHINENGRAGATVLIGYLHAGERKKIAKFQNLFYLCSCNFPKDRYN